MKAMLNPLKQSAMKTVRFFIIVILLSSTYLLFGQSTFIPKADLYTIEGKLTDTRKLTTDNQVVIFFFWSTSNRKSIEQLRLLNEQLSENTTDMQVKVVGICTDIQGNPGTLPALVSGMDLDFEVFIDRNNEVQRACSVPDVPYTIIFDGVHNLSCRCSGSPEDACNFVSNEISRNIAELRSR